MKVQQINQANCYAKKPMKSRVNVKSKPINFNGYDSIMRDIILRDLPNFMDANSAYFKAYNELLNSSGARRGRFFNTLSEIGLYNPTHLVDSLCKPIGELSSPLRDVILDTKGKLNEPLLTLSKDVGLFIGNYGKIGFFNSIFNLQDAANDIRIILQNGPNQEFVVSRYKKSGYKVEQRIGNSVTESTFPYYNRSSKKQYNMGDTHVPVGP